VKLSDWELMTQTSWVDGFISAFNHYVRQSGDVATGIDTNGIFARIDTYCASHPLDSVAVPRLRLSKSSSSVTKEQGGYRCLLLKVSTSGVF